MRKFHLKHGIFVLLIAVFLCVAVVLVVSTGRQKTVQESGEHVAEEASADSGTDADSVVATVFMTSDISPEGLMAAYKALGRTVSGKVAVKLSTGEPGGNNFLSADLIKELVQSVDATIVECNTAYGGKRASTAMHKQAAEDHGFTAIAPFDVMDEEGEISLPFPDGKNIQEAWVGSHFKNYDSFLVLTHFKGHAMGGFGGSIKNIAIGISSATGKSWVHTAGKTKDLSQMWPTIRDTEQDHFLESMAEAAGAMMNALGENIVYINVMNNLSVDCDCDSSPADPTMADIGILAYLDPVALDKACVDLVYAAHDGHDLIERMESRNGIHTLEHGETLGIGSQQYELVMIDG